MSGDQNKPTQMSYRRLLVWGSVTSSSIFINVSSADPLTDVVDITAARCSTPHPSPSRARLAIRRSGQVVTARKLRHMRSANKEGAVSSGDAYSFCA